MPRVNVSYPPSTNRMWRSYKGRVVKTPAVKLFQSEIRAEFKKTEAEMITGDVELTVFLYPKKPKAYKKGQRVRSIDLSNALKAAEDALSGLAYQDDRQVTKISLYKCPPVENGGMTIIWDEAEPIEE